MVGRGDNVGGDIVECGWMGWGGGMTRMEGDEEDGNTTNRAAFMLSGGEGGL